MLQKEKESSLDPNQLRQTKESEESEQKHDADKVAHFAKLGKSFARGGSSLLSPTAGRGGGRGAGIFSPGGRGKNI
jgi:hypothetical protein